MTWRDDLRPASFRGVPFEVEPQNGISGEEGRRFVADESPETDALAPTNDLGRIRPAFRVRGFVIGDDYLDKRDRLREALNAYGPGPLIHPYRGSVRVQVGNVSWAHGPGHGACTFEWDCVDAGGQPLPIVTPLPAAQATDQAALASATATALYGQTDDPGKLFLQEAEAFDRFVAIPGGLAALVNNDEWSAEVAAAVAEALQTIDKARELLRYVRSTIVLTWQLAGVLAGPRRDAIDNISDGVRVLSLIRVVELVTEATYSNADQAEETMADIAAELGEWMGGILDIDLYTQLLDLRTIMVDTLTAVADRLPRKKPILVPVPTPAIVVAFDQYNTRSFSRLTARERELIEMNGIGHPGFVVGPIDVLSR